MDAWKWLNTPWLENSHFSLTPFALAQLIFFPIFLHFLAKFAEGVIRKKVVSDPSLGYALGKVLYYVVAVFGAFWLLSEIGINFASLAAFAGALGVGIGLGLQSIAKNFISGLILLLGRQIRPDDRIEFQTFSGDVLSIGLNSTRIRTSDEAYLIVPNSILVENPVVNWTLEDKRRLVSTEVGVSYSADPHHIQKVLEEEAMKVEGVLPQPAPSARLVSFDESSLRFRLVVWTSDFVLVPQKLKSQLNLAIFDRFSKEGIDIPFPQQVVHQIGVGEPSPTGPKPD